MPTSSSRSNKTDPRVGIIAHRRFGSGNEFEERYFRNRMPEWYKIYKTILSSLRKTFDPFFLPGLTSRYTSFIAHDVKDDKQSAENWVMETRYVPIQYAHGWHGANVPYLPMSCGLTSGITELMHSDSSDCSSLSYCRTASIKSKKWMSASNFKSKITRRRVISRFLQIENKTVEESPTLLMQLIILQSYDGSFTLNEALAPILGKTLKEMKAGICLEQAFN